MTLTPEEKKTRARAYSKVYHEAHKEEAKAL